MHMCTCSTPLNNVLLGFTVVVGIIIADFNPYIEMRYMYMYIYMYIYVNVQ